MNQKLLEELSEVDIRMVNLETLVDANQITLDYTIPQNKRAEYLLSQLKNPYCFKVGEIAVKIGFNENERSFEDAFLAILKREKNSL